MRPDDGRGESFTADTASRLALASRPSTSQPSPQSSLSSPHQTRCRPIAGVATLIFISRISSTSSSSNKTASRRPPKGRREAPPSSEEALVSSWVASLVPSLRTKALFLNLTFISLTSLSAESANLVSSHSLRPSRFLRRADRSPPPSPFLLSSSRMRCPQTPLLPLPQIP